MTAVSVVLFLGLAALGWGDVNGLIAHPARSCGLMTIALAAFVSLFSGIHLGGCARADAHGRWRLAPLALISTAMASLPAYADRRDLATIDGDLVRYCGLLLLVVGSVVRVGPMFVLGDRFTWPLATQRTHELQTSGFYRFVRHPSYLGALLGGIGWVLLFRSGLGLILIAALFPSFLPIMLAEESMLMKEFGEAYTHYQRRTWRLIPGIY